MYPILPRQSYLVQLRAIVVKATHQTGDPTQVFGLCALNKTALCGR